jgi:Caspase domain
MNNLLRGLAFGILYLTTHGLVAAEPSGRVALVVGVGAYPDAPLKNPVSDAKAVGEMLTGQLGFAVEYCENPDRVTLLNCFEKFKDDASNAEIVLFYYAGHGMENLDGGENYLIPADAPVKEVAQSEAVLKAYGVNVMDLSNEMTESTPGVKIWLLDCCRERPADRALGGEISAGGGLNHYRDEDIPSETLYMFAAKPKLLASDGLERGPFTQSLLEILPTQTGNLMQVFQNVKSRLKQLTGGQQQAWMKYDGAGEILWDKGFLTTVSKSNNDFTPTSLPLPLLGAGSEEVASSANSTTPPAPMSMAAKRAKMEKDKQARAAAETVGNAPTSPSVNTVVEEQSAKPAESTMDTSPIDLNKLPSLNALNAPKETPLAAPPIASRGSRQQPISSPQPTNPSPAKSYQPSYNFDDDFGPDGDLDMGDTYDNKSEKRGNLLRNAIGIYNLLR